MSRARHLNRKPVLIDVPHLCILGMIQPSVVTLAVPALYGQLLVILPYPALMTLPESSNLPASLEL